MDDSTLKSCDMYAIALYETGSDAAATLMKPILKEKAAREAEEAAKAAEEPAEAVGDAVEEAAEAVGDAAAEEAKGGCGSMIGGCLIVLITVLGSAWISRRKD